MQKKYCNPPRRRVVCAFLFSKLTEAVAAFPFFSGLLLLLVVVVFSFFVLPLAAFIPFPVRK